MPKTSISARFVFHVRYLNRFNTPAMKMPDQAAWAASLHQVTHNPWVVSPVSMLHASSLVLSFTPSASYLVVNSCCLWFAKPSQHHKVYCYQHAQCTKPLEVWRSPNILLSGKAFCWALCPVLRHTCGIQPTNLAVFCLALYDNNYKCIVITMHSLPNLFKHNAGKKAFYWVSCLMLCNHPTNFASFVVQSKPKTIHVLQSTCAFHQTWVLARQTMTVGIDCWVIVVLHSSWVWTVW